MHRKPEVFSFLAGNPFSFSLGRQVSQSREQQRNPEQVKKARRAEEGLAAEEASGAKHFYQII